jgi:hypothetical protein
VTTLAHVPVLAVLALGLAAPLLAVDYYVSSTGDDANPGTSPTQAWATVAAVNLRDFAPGDRVLFQGGRTFAGTGIVFDKLDSGTAAEPIVVSSYGSGRATIDPGNDHGFYGHLAQGVEIRNINFVGFGDRTVVQDGIAFLNDEMDALRSYLRIVDVDVSYFGRHGIAIQGGMGRAGWRDVVVERVTVSDCHVTGILVAARAPYANQEVHVRQALVDGTLGIPNATEPTGTGILLGEAESSSVTRSVARLNGPLCNAADCATGITARASRRVVIAHNESYDNRAGGNYEGGGFSFEDDTTESVLEHNYSHGNAGAGYTLRQSTLGESAGNAVRYNLSQDDGRRNQYGAVEVYGAVQNATVHGNTLFLSPPPAGSPVAIRVRNDLSPTLDVAKLRLANNIVVTDGAIPLVDVAPTQLDEPGQITFVGNAYFAQDGVFVWRWGRANYDDLARWRDATGQERIDLEDLGFDVDPLLDQPGQAPTLGDASLLETITAYQLQPTSPLVDQGLDLVARFGIDPGPVDFWGTALPQGRAFDVGAHERQGSAVPPQLLRALVATLDPPTPALADVYPFDPANPLTPAVIDPFASGATLAFEPLDPLELYQVWPPGGTLQVVRETGTDSARFTWR